jgi:hypothetical protein
MAGVVKKAGRFNSDLQVLLFFMLKEDKVLYSICPVEILVFL